MGFVKEKYEREQNYSDAYIWEHLKRRTFIKLQTFDQNILVINVEVYKVFFYDTFFIDDIFT